MAAADNTTSAHTGWSIPIVVTSPVARSVIGRSWSLTLRCSCCLGGVCEIPAGPTEFVGGSPLALWTRLS